MFAILHCALLLTTHPRNFSKAQDTRTHLRGHDSVLGLCVTHAAARHLCLMVQPLSHGDLRCWRTWAHCGVWCERRETPAITCKICQRWPAQQSTSESSHVAHGWHTCVSHRQSRQTFHMREHETESAASRRQFDSRQQQRHTEMTTSECFALLAGWWWWCCCSGASAGGSADADVCYCQAYTSVLAPTSIHCIFVFLALHALCAAVLLSILSIVHL